MLKDKLYFKNLDSIRFLAALMVFMQHGMSPSYAYLPCDSPFFERLLHTISNGGIGVSIFFVLSGFLISYLLISEYEINGTISLKKFYIRRILRIWPLYYLVVAFTFLIYPFLKSMLGTNNPLSSNLFYHLSFLSNFDVINLVRYFPGNDAMSQNITWSVSIEEQFYLFWPLLFLFLPKRAWFSAIMLVIAGSLMFRILNSDDSAVLYFHTLSVLLDLGIGGLMALLIKTQKKATAFFVECSTRTHLSFFIISFCLINWSDILFSFKYGNAIGRIFISFSFALIISAQALTKSNSKLNLVRLGFANRWGKYTYGIYLIHPIAITLIDVLVRVIHIPNENFVSLILIGFTGFILTLGLSKLSYKYYESKFLALKDKFSIIRTHE